MKNGKELTTKSTGMSLENVASMDFEKVFHKAVEIFSDQMMLEKDPNEITVKDLEVSKAKANNFLDAIAGVLEISHQVEVLSAEKDKFKRSDELRVLNSLRRSTEKCALGLESTISMAQERLEMLMQDISQADPEKIAMLQAVLNSCVETGQKLIGSMSRLVQLERMSGGRVWGANRYANLGMRTVEGLDKASTTKGLPGYTTGRAGPREISVSDIAGLEEDEDSFDDDLEDADL